MSPQADVEDIVSLLFCWQEAGYEMRIRDWSSDVCSSDLNVGGDMSIDSEGDMTVQGSNVNVGGNADVKADSVNILQGNDVDRKTSTTETATSLRTSSGISRITSTYAGAWKRVG